MSKTRRHLELATGILSLVGGLVMFVAWVVAISDIDNTVHWGISLTAIIVCGLLIPFGAILCVGVSAYSKWAVKNVKIKIENDIPTKWTPETIQAKSTREYSIILGILFGIFATLTIGSIIVLSIGTVTSPAISGVVLVYSVIQSALALLVIKLK
jgi:hypothetical protein